MLRASQMTVLSVFGLTSPSFAGEAADAATLFRDICIATEGDLVVAKERALANGFEFDGDEGRLAGSKGWPMVTLTPASDGDMHDRCAILGETLAEEAIADVAMSKGLIEIPKEKIAGDLFEGRVFRTFVSRECAEAADLTASCEMVQFLGDTRPEGASSTPIFRKFNYVPSRKPVS